MPQLISPSSSPRHHQQDQEDTVTLNASSLVQLYVTIYCDFFIFLIHFSLFEHQYQTGMEGHEIPIT